ncbi:MAG: CPBP family intramembrane metalloprotease [Planctomycetes bacterium]|nr:CPBP family intramembrane metalloprotease [Planctomycetota bacterium]
MLTGLLWVLSVLVTHVIGIAAASVALFATNVDILKAIAANPKAAEEVLKPFLKDNVFFVMAGEMLVFVLAAILVTRLKHGRDTARVLGLRRMPPGSLLLIVVSVLPLSVLCSGLHEKVLPVWDAIAREYPQLDIFGGLNVNQKLLPLGESVPAWALLLVIAVAPAIGEELIFRGIIGHGLVARYGITVGVLATSAYFAAVHMHPAHALTLMPLAVFMHLSWLATRSFYAPVLIHFLNNGLAVFALSNSERLKEAAQATGEMETHWAMIALAAVALIPAAIALWKSRVEFRFADGSAWSPGYETASTPPAGVDATPVSEPGSFGMYVAALFLCGGISILFIASTGMALLQK